MKTIYITRTYLELAPTEYCNLLWRFGSARYLLAYLLVHACADTFNTCRHDRGLTLTYLGAHRMRTLTEILVM